jgi:tetratricopeptide (TPR) repeat protein
MQKRMRRFLGVFIAGVVLFCSGCSGLGLVNAEFKMSQDDYEGAIPIYKTYIEKNPDAVTPRTRLGFAYLKTGQLDQAVEALEKVLELEPDDSYAHLYLGMAYLNQEEFGKAAAVWQGYRDKKKPLVEEEIKRLTTLLLIAESQKAAREALANEAQLQTLEGAPNSVAVCYYKDFTPDKQLAAFQKGLAAMVITDLSKIRQLQVVERVRLQAMFEEMKLGQTGIVDPQTAPRVGKLLGAETLVSGGLADGLQITTTVSSSSRAEVVGGATTTVPNERFFEIPRQIVLEVAEIMDVTLTSEEKVALDFPHTTNYKAFIYYGQALDALDAGHWSNAKDFYALALLEDPKFDLAREGKDGCPGADAPSLARLKDMKPQQLIASVEDRLTSAKADQGTADKDAAAAGREGGGGH